jgi:hypothetical protein
MLAIPGAPCQGHSVTTIHRTRGRSGRRRGAPRGAPPARRACLLLLSLFGTLGRGGRPPARRAGGPGRRRGRPPARCAGGRPPLPRHAAAPCLARQRPTHAPPQPQAHHHHPHLCCKACNGQPAMDSLQWTINGFSGCRWGGASQGWGAAHPAAAARPPGRARGARVGVGGKGDDGLTETSAGEGWTGAGARTGELAVRRRAAAPPSAAGRPGCMEKFAGAPRGGAAGRGARSTGRRARSPRAAAHYSRPCSRCPNSASASRICGFRLAATARSASCSLPAPSTVNSNSRSSGSSWAEEISLISIAPLIWGPGGWGGSVWGCGRLAGRA